jgi:dTDP-N-acetylfucosamine:lipid II N-acetylfucosaminyltransferase
MEKEKRILHIMHESIFTSNFISFMKQNFPIENHYYFIRSRSVCRSKGDSMIKNYTFSLFNILNQIKDLYRISSSIDRIYLHSFQDPRLLIVFFFCFFSLKKMHWIVWGGDLYGFSKLSFIHQYFKRFLIKKMGGIVVLVDKDGDIAREKLNLRADFKIEQCLFYTSTILNRKLKALSDTTLMSSLNGGTNVLVGNSANPSNKHIEMIRKLKALSDNNEITELNVFCILSYGGNEDYKKQVIDFGINAFKDKFVVISDYIPVMEYNYLLSKIDIAFFGMERQQGLGNIFVLLEYGCTVYLNGNSSTAKWLNHNEVNYFDIELAQELIVLSMEEKMENAALLRSLFNESKHKADLEKLF